jgi:hypothetical protein
MQEKVLNNDLDSLKDERLKLIKERENFEREKSEE